MKPDDYLKKILKQQTFDDDDQELKDLRQRRQDIDKQLRAHFSGSSPSIKWAGSMAKGTMIRESYDGDMTCYFLEDEKKAGETLKAIYENVEKGLSKDYQVQRKASALRVRDLKDWSTDLHIDVVPGRYTDASKSDVFLHRTTPEKERLKTNLQTHIDHIGDSGVVDAIRLTKLWKARNGLAPAKTFVLELLVVKLLKGKESLGVSAQLEDVWIEFRDNAENLSVEDPANSNNDLKPILDECRYLLSSAASTTLMQIENDGWEAVFGELEEDDRDAESGGGRPDRTVALRAAVASVAIPTKPYSNTP
jgi:hypothetical protein